MALNRAHGNCAHEGRRLGSARTIVEGGAKSTLLNCARAPPLAGLTGAQPSTMVRPNPDGPVTTSRRLARVRRLFWRRDREPRRSTSRQRAAARGRALLIWGRCSWTDRIGRGGEFFVDSSDHPSPDREGAGAPGRGAAGRGGVAGRQRVCAAAREETPAADADRARPIATAAAAGA